MTNDEFSFEYLSVINDILLPTYLIIKYDQDLYRATINRIIYLYSRMSNCKLK